MLGKETALSWDIDTPEKKVTGARAKIIVASAVLRRPEDDVYTFDGLGLQYMIKGTSELIIKSWFASTINQTRAYFLVQKSSVRLTINGSWQFRL